MSGFVSKNPEEVSQQKVHMKWLDAILKFFMANLIYACVRACVRVCVRVCVHLTNNIFLIISN